MPTSRRRRRSRKPREPKGTTIESMFDRARSYGTRLRGPSLLYHYTSWSAAESIVASQRFWATAHDCTNDRDELKSADDAVIEIINARENAATGVARRCLELFRQKYLQLRISETRRVYL